MTTRSSRCLVVHTIAISFSVVTFTTLSALIPTTAQADQPGAIFAQKLQLEHQLTTTINETLAPLASPGRAFVSVSVKMDARLITEIKKSKGRGMSFTVGRVSAQKHIKLPGLPQMRPGKISEPVKIHIDPKGKDQTSTHMIGIVQGVSVRLYADNDLGKPRMVAAKKAIASIAGLQPKRGDKLEIIRITPTPKKVEKVDLFGLTAIPFGLVGAAFVIAIAMLIGGRRTVAAVEAR
ncbi:MAG: hypothetical protein JRH20_25455, partial [Deltaproteobacteria bacterium]|nr:hypothetical protein [Deltaproteobacteria bacterium]